MNTLLGKIILFSLFFAGFHSNAYSKTCTIFLGNDSNNIINLDSRRKGTASLFQEALDTFDFPAEANFYTFETIFRIALYQAHEGIDFYTGLPLAYDEMSIDHIIPRSGGPGNLAKDINNVYNFVPTTSDINNRKGNKFTKDDFISLEENRDIYGPRTMALLKLFGAFDERETTYQIASEVYEAKRSKYRFTPEEAKIIGLDRKIKGPLTFRRHLEKPAKFIDEILYLLTLDLKSYTEDELEEALESRIITLEFDKDAVDDFVFLGHEQLFAEMFYRKYSAGLDEASLSFRTQVLKVIEHSYFVETNKVKVKVTLDIHPLLLLKLKGIDSEEREEILEAIINIFKDQDITKFEFIKWSE